jgi:hypothetical protein
VVTAPARREVMRVMVTRGLSERRALTVVPMSASALRYVPRPDQDVDLRERIVALAHRHRRCGAGMIYLKFRQEFADTSVHSLIIAVQFAEGRSALSIVMTSSGTVPRSSFTPRFFRASATTTKLPPRPAAVRASGVSVSSRM